MSCLEATLWPTQACGYHDLTLTGLQLQLQFCHAAQRAQLFLSVLTILHHLFVCFHCKCSGDVGIGLNARRLRENFLNRFNVTYSLRPVGELGTVFRRYPELWKVFVEEKELPGR